MVDEKAAAAAKDATRASESPSPVANPEVLSASGTVTAWGVKRQLGPWCLRLAGSGLLVWAVSLVSPHVPLPMPWSFCVAFGAVCAQTMVVGRVAPFGDRRWFWGLTPFLLLGGALILTLRPPLSGADAAAVTVMLLGAGSLIGAVIGGEIKHPGHLLPVAVVSSLVDVFSVLHPSGPTAHVVRSEVALNLLVLPWPFLGTPHIAPVLGVGDVAFAALYFSASRAHGLSLRRTWLALGFGCLVTLLVLLTFVQAVPALPMFGLAMLIAHPEARRLPKEERKQALLGLGIVCVLFAAVFVLR